MQSPSGLRPGVARCAACGVGNTRPWPTDAELDAAYGGWYRPPSGRFSGVGDAVLRRFRGRLARRLDRIAPPGPVLDVGAGDGALLDALRAAAATALGLEREPDAARRARRGDSRGRGAVGGDRLLALARAPARRRARRSTRAAAPARARRRARRRRAERRQPAGAACSATAGSRSTCPPPRPPAGGRRCSTGCEPLGLRGRARQPPARRPGRVRLAARPGRQRCPGTPTSTTRSAAPRRAPAPMSAAAAAPRRCAAGRCCSRSRAPARASRSRPARRHRLRGGAPWLSARRGQGDRRDAGAATRPRRSSRPSRRSRATGSTRSSSSTTTPPTRPSSSPASCRCT